MIECPSCAVKVEKKNDVCPICGYEFPQQKSNVKYVVLVLVILFSYPLIRLLMNLLKSF
jgi:hypothetical protein